MKHNIKIKNRNANGYILGGLVFKSLVAAEQHCDKHGIDPDFIRWEDTPEFKKELRNTAMTQKLVLRYVISILQNSMKHNRDTLNRISDEANHCHPLEIDYMKCNVSEYVGKTAGLYEAYKILTSKCDELESITDWASNELTILERMN